MGYLLVVFLVGGLILVHELGHLLAARWLGIGVSRFSIGLGPKLWGFRRSGVEYWLALIPFGGYVLPELSDEHGYLRIPSARRVVFALCGPAANVAAAVLLLCIYNVASGNLSLHGLLVAPFVQTGQMLGRIVAAIGELLSHPGQIAGVVGIVALGGRHVGLDVARAAVFSAMISLNLAIFNLLPLPPLDGGKIVLGLLERLRPGFARAYVPICAVGWVLLLGLLLYATVQDISRCLA